MLRLLIILLFTAPALAQEEIRINPDLQRGLDGRGKIDTLSDEQLSKIAQDSILLKRMGLNSDVLKKALELQKKERDAIFSNKKAKMIKEVITVSTDPGAESPVIYTSPGHETLVNVIDQTGQPWPIVEASSGNDLLFQTEAVEAHEYKNVFKLISLERVGSSNATLLLKGKALSVTFRIENSKNKYHGQPILQITETGPNGKLMPVVLRHVPVRNDKLVKNLMYSVAPDDFKKLVSSNNLVSAWKSPKGKVFLKTKLYPVNPRPSSTTSGPSGFSIYEVEDWPVLIMADENGIEHQVDISEEL